MGIGDASRQGLDGILAVGEEPTFGTRAITATMLFFEYLAGSGIKRNIEKQPLEHMNNSRNSTKLVTLKDTAEGPIEFDFNPAEDAQMIMIKQAFGGTVTSASTGVAGFITHTFKEGDMESNDSSVSAADVKSLTFWHKKGATTTSSWVSTGCRVNQMTIAGEIGGMVKMSFDIIGQDHSVSADAQTVSFTTQLPATFANVTILQATTTASTLVAEKYQTFELVLNNNLDNGDEAFALGGAQIEVLPPTNRVVTLNLTQRHDTTTAYSRFVENTANAIRLFIDTGVTVGSASGNTTYSMYFDLPKVYFKNSQPEDSEVGIISQTIEGTAIADSQTGTMIGAVGVNDTAGY